MKRPALGELIRNNVFFDTCVYHLAGIELLLKIVPADNILFGSEMVGAVRGIDPETGHHFDDTKRYIDGVSWLSEADRKKIFEGTARKVYPRINKAPAVTIAGRAFEGVAATAPAAVPGGSSDR
jgi:4-oxalmesaconate hydratase